MGSWARIADAGSLARAGEIRGKLLMIWGSADPHVPEAGRAEIDRKLREAKVDYAVKLYPAEHAFMRDEGPRLRSGSHRPSIRGHDRALSRRFRSSLYLKLWYADLQSAFW